VLVLGVCAALAVGCAEPANDEASADSGAPTDAGSGLPDVTELAFIRTQQGPRTLVAGTAPGDDLSHVEITFLDTKGQSVAVDLNGDGVPDTKQFEIQGTGLARDEAFFLTLQSATALEESVAGISARAVNSAGLSGASQLASLSEPLVRALGSACDPRGFDTCASGALCLSSAATKATCGAARELRRAACASAQRLNPFAGVVRVIGTLQARSLYTPPAGCISESAIASADAVVNLRLTRAARTVTLTTKDSRTNFDTVLYLLKSCVDDTSGVLACNDDTGDRTSRITVGNLPAGDYTVVVDSLTDAAGNYALTVSAQ
jgi:hypothetical protein